MIKGTFRLRSNIGLHARPSMKISQLARSYGSTEITIENPETGMKADAKSLLSLLSLGADAGKTLNLAVVGEEEEKAFKEISEVIENFTVSQ